MAAAKATVACKVHLPLASRKLFWYYMRLFTAEAFDKKDLFQPCTDTYDIESRFYSLPDDVQKPMLEANRTYVGWPSSDPSAPSPHTTGGAVDIWLYEGDVPANLGVPFDWMKETAGAFYHLKWRRQRFAGNDRRISLNRSKLLLSMTKTGFTCYGPELWHFNYGNQMDALVKNTTAWYSYIEPE